MLPIYVSLFMLGFPGRYGIMYRRVGGLAEMVSLAKRFSYSREFQPFFEINVWFR